MDGVSNRAEGIGEYGHEALRVCGHWLYVRKCKHDEVQGGVAIPEKSQENTGWAEVLAVGPECGKKRDKSDPRRKVGGAESGWTLWLDNPLRVGDLVLCPDTHVWGIRRSPMCDYEFFVDESVILAYERPGENGA